MLSRVWRRSSTI